MELIQRAFEAFNRRDLDAFLELMDPGVEFTPYERVLEGLGPYRGHDGVRTWWDEAFTVFPAFRVEPGEIRDHGDVTLAHGRLRGEGFERRGIRLSDVAYRQMAGQETGLVERLRD